MTRDNIAKFLRNLFRSPTSEAVQDAGRRTIHCDRAYGSFGSKADARNNPGSLLTADIQSVMKYI